MTNRTPAGIVLLILAPELYAGYEPRTLQVAIVGDTTRAIVLNRFPK